MTQNILDYVNSILLITNQLWQTNDPKRPVLRKLDYLDH
jgi:hypothetical protein